VAVNPFLFGKVIFADSEPTIEPAWQHIEWKWFNPTNCKWYELVDGTWQERGDIEFATSDHVHPTLGDTNFTGTISADGEAGLTGAKVLDGKRLTFKNGILVGYEVV